MAQYMMALDSGTTSNRCILFNEKGEMYTVETIAEMVYEKVQTVIG